MGSTLKKFINNSNKLAKSVRSQYELGAVGIQVSED